MSSPSPLSLTITVREELFLILSLSPVAPPPPVTKEDTLESGGEGRWGEGRGHQSLEHRHV